MKFLPAGQTNLPELLATLRRLREVDGWLQRLHTAHLPLLSPRARHRTEATLRMLNCAMPLTDRSIRKVERVLEKEQR